VEGSWADAVGTRREDGVVVIKVTATNSWSRRINHLLLDEVEKPVFLRLLRRELRRHRGARRAAEVLAELEGVGVEGSAVAGVFWSLQAANHLRDCEGIEKTICLLEGREFLEGKPRGAG
jgi:hypothetical protein